jgi:hypothetical protein
LSQALYAAGKIDPTELKNFQHLGSIRNDCAHSKEGVNEEDLKEGAKELIEKVKKLTLYMVYFPYFYDIFFSSF